MTEPALPLGGAETQVAALALASLLCGVVGTLVVLRRLVALAGGVAHAAFGGIGAAVALGIAPRWGAAGVALGAASALAAVSRRRVSGDATVGVLWAVGMAAGMVLLRGSADEHVGVEGYLFGEIERVRAPSLLFLGLLTLVVIAVFALYRRDLVAAAFDAEHARLRGLPVALLDWIELCLVALALVALLELVGVMLAIALLAIPPLVAARLFRGLPAIVAGATVSAAVMSFGGLALARALIWPAGPTIALAGGALLAVSWLRGPRAHRGG